MQFTTARDFEFISLSPCSTLRATLLSNSCSRRSLMFLDVTNLPSFQQMGNHSLERSYSQSAHLQREEELFYILWSHKVSEIYNFSIPVTQTMSPASALSTSTLSKPHDPKPGEFFLFFVLLQHRSLQLDRLV